MPRRTASSPRRHRFAARFERLEGRRLLSAAGGSVAAGTAGFVEYAPDLFARPIAAAPSAAVAPAAQAIAPPYTPAQIRSAYVGSGYTGEQQTIAIVAAGDDPTIGADLAGFDARFGIRPADLTTVYTSGSAVVGTPPAATMASTLTIALDVEWAHAIAPLAKILLVEAASTADADLLGAVDYAVARGASQVDLSFARAAAAGDPALDAHFDKPGVSFFAPAGDNGAGVAFPASSPYVTGVGGTTLTLSANSGYGTNTASIAPANSSGETLSETAWSGSGGGTAAMVARPSFQDGFQAATGRGVPDVAYDADPNTGYYVLANGTYYEVGGTAAGASQWAAIVALANSTRIEFGAPTIGTGLAYGLNTALYGLAGGTSYTNPHQDFNDITAGNDGGNAAAAGYDTVTGLGTPDANTLLQDLISYGDETAGPAVGDSGFEAVAVGAGPAAYRYDPTGSAWSFAGTSGVTGTNSGFTSANANAPQGNQVAFLQNQGSFSQAIAGWATGTYRVTFSAAERGNIGSTQAIEVLVDGKSIGTITPTKTSYATYGTADISLTAGTHTLTFQGVSSAGDNTAFVDNVAIFQDINSPYDPTIGDYEFEDVPVGSGSAAYVYDPTTSPWTFTGSAGISGNNSAFTAGVDRSYSPQVAFLQNQGSFSQAVPNIPAGSYQIYFLAAQRANNGVSNQSIRVLVDGTAVATITPTTTSYRTYGTAAFAVGAGTHTITFQGLGPAGGDNTAFIDEVGMQEASLPDVKDGSFEDDPVGSGPGAYVYDPTASAWTFGGSAGITGNGSGFTAGNAAAPDGAQVAFLQNQGTISQTIAGWAAGSYILSFDAAQRANNGGSNQSFEVLIDDAVVATYNPRGTYYQAFSTPAFTVGAGTHTISFVGLGPSGGDNTVFLDDVTIDDVFG